MAVSRAERREQREPLVAEVFGPERSSTALDLLELVELAWHDCYGEVTPSAAVIDDILVISDGSIDGLIRAARLAVTDWRDLRLLAEERRGTQARDA